MDRRHFLATLAMGTGAAVLPAKWAMTQDRGQDLRVLSEGAPNAFDSFSPGVNRNALQITWNVYDRLLTFGYKPQPDGFASFDYYDIRPELAESYEVSADGRQILFRLRPDATFHDGAPVTAEDVKFSLDRVLASPIGRSQFATGSLTDPAQFVVVDSHTFRIDLPQPDRLALPNLALTYPIIVNSALARQHATEADPFASEWLRMNPAGGGAFRVADSALGERVLFERFEGWKSGPLPGIRRVLWQTVPQPETRLAALRKGDADIVQDIPAPDVARLQEEPELKVAGMPTAAFQFIGMNGGIAPFDDVRVRQAIAHALPYEEMFRTALFNRGAPLFGPAPEGDLSFPQPLGTVTDPERAKALLEEAGLEDGFETTFSYDLSQASVAEPVALLLQDALGKIGIRVTIQKVPSGQLGSLLQEKKVPFYFEASIAFLRDPDYFFRIFYTGTTRWNFGNYQNAEFAELVEKARFETDRATYEADVARMIQMVKEDMPIILLWHPTLDVAMRRDVEGYSFIFHRMLELRTLSRD
ncbi:ABC transporter substrate-binding protein [Haematobacter missouriensis]|nr:ABC transporter substrate-binding protein [Haematobacter missouriensis]KFI33379.1 ABC transporter substrate-binding protein [Haematobacter missouriensis]